MIVKDQLQEFIIEGSGSRFKASNLGLELDHTTTHMNVTQTRLRIYQLEGETVDVVNKKGKVTATWKFIWEAEEDPSLAIKRAEQFAECGLCDHDFNDPGLNLCDLFFKLLPGDMDKQLDLLNEQICALNKNLTRKVFNKRTVLDCTMDEYKTFIAVLIGASCFYKRGLLYGLRRLRVLLHLWNLDDT